MQIQLENQQFASIHADALVTYIFDQDKKIDGLLGDIDSAMDGRIAALVASGEITGKAPQTVLVHFPEGMDAKRLLIIGAGKVDKFATGDLRKIAGTALRYLKTRGVKKFVFLAREGERGTAAVQAVVEGLTVADFESNKYHTEKKKDQEIQTVLLAGFDGSQNLQEAIEHGRVISESQNFARDLINEPSNRLTPRMLASKAEAMAKEVGLGVEIPDEPVLGLVGKAVTFDTGGISIKPADRMELMKYDMGGGATMIGAMRALAYLKPAISVIAVIPATENMPGGRAQKPGDVQVAMSGKTIEVINTDAEG